MRRLCDVQRLLLDSEHFALSGSDVKVELDIAADLWSAEVDEGQSKQAVSNLVINAEQSMEDAGRLIVRARNFVARQPPSPSAGVGPYVLLELKDFGVGIPRELQEMVMDPYFSTKDTGSGLGLATVLAILRRHQGWVELESAPDEGTLFRLCFPAKSAWKPVEESVPDLEFTGTGSVLVMDDDPHVQALHRTALSEPGHEAEVVPDGEACVKRYCEAKEEGRGCDSVIMDLTVSGGMGARRPWPRFGSVIPKPLPSSPVATRRTSSCRTIVRPGSRAHCPSRSPSQDSGEY